MWCDGMNRGNSCHSLQARGLVLFSSSRSSLGTGVMGHRWTPGLDSMGRAVRCDDMNRGRSMAWIVWCEGLNRVFSQHRDYRIDRTPGWDSMGGDVWCDDMNRGSSYHSS